MSEHLDYFGLSRSPFADDSHASVVVGTRALRKVVSRIQAALRDGSARIGVGGVPGIGKTRLARALPKLFAGNARVATVFDPELDWRTLRSALARDWQLAAERLSRASLLEAARSHRLVLVIDAAERAPESLFEHLDVLHDIQDEDGAPVITVILFLRSSGEESSGATAAQTWLDRNAAARVRFEPLAPDSVADYLERQLARAGSTTPIFTPRAALAIHAETDGVPGAISQLAERLLIDAAVRRLRTIDEPFVRERQGLPRERAAMAASLGTAPAEDAWDDADHHPRESSDAAVPVLDQAVATPASEPRRPGAAFPALAATGEADATSAAGAARATDGSEASGADPDLEAYLSAPPTAAELRAIRGGFLRRNGRLIAGISAGVALGGALVALLMHGPSSDAVGLASSTPAPASADARADAAGSTTSPPSPAASADGGVGSSGLVLGRLRGPVSPAPVASSRAEAPTPARSSSRDALDDAPSPLQRASDFEDDDEPPTPPAHGLRDDDSGSDLPDLRPNASSPAAAASTELP